MPDTHIKDFPRKYAEGDLYRHTQFTIGSTECLNVYIHHIIDSQGTLYQVIQDSRLKAIRMCLKIHRIYDRSGYWQLPFFIQNTPSPVQCFKKTSHGCPNKLRPNTAVDIESHDKTANNHIHIRLLPLNLLNAHIRISLIWFKCTNCTYGKYCVNEPRSLKWHNINEFPTT